MTQAPAWSLLIGAAGRISLWASVVLFLLTLVFLALGQRRFSRIAFFLGGLGFVVAFGALTALFVTHQFQFQYVFQHAALNHETKYLVSGVWSGQEGSFLLWGLLSAILGSLASRGSGKFETPFVAVFAVFLGSLAAILCFESPFVTLPLLDGKQFVPADGVGLAPSLLNYWMVIHPPTIFVGFATLTVLFAYSFAALIKRDLVGWIPYVRPWAVFNLAVLGVGLCMGGFWAYETLGWGGFWAWDPVENTSFVPWCLVIAFVHGMFVQQAQKKWHAANAIFAALPFVLFLYGTFLTRSGFLGDTSVHSFAQMDRSALRLLIGLLVLTAVAFLVNFAINVRRAAPSREPEDAAASPLTRSRFYGIGIWLLYFLAATTAFGMSLPFVTGFFKETKVVEEGLYHDLLVWVYVPLMLVMAVAPFVGWRGTRMREILNRLTNCLAITIGIIGCILLWMKSPGFHAPEQSETVNFAFFQYDAPKVSWVLFLSGLSLFAAVASFWRMFETIKRSKSSAWAMLAHFGLAMTLFGLVFSRGFEQKIQTQVHKKEKSTAFGYELLEAGATKQFDDRNNKVKVDVKGNGESFTAFPGLYFVPGQNDEPSPMIWPFVKRNGLVDYYFTIYQPVFEATGATEMPLSDDPTNPTARAYKNMMLIYHGFRTAGTMGEEDTALIADMTVVTSEGSQKVEPSILITKDRQIVPIDARIGEDYTLRLLKIDAESKAATVQIEFVEPAFPLEVYFKPLTLFVWLGVGIMTLGGLLSAASRRKEKRALSSDATEPSP